MRSAETKKGDDRGAAGRLRQVFARNRPRSTVLAGVRRPLVAVFAISMTINGLILSVPLTRFALFDLVLNSRNVTTLWMVVIGGVVALTVYGGLLATRGWALTRAGNAFDENVAPQLMRRAFRSQGGADVTARAQVFADLDTVRGFLSGNAITGLFDLPWAPLFLAAAFMIHPLLGAVGTGFALIALVLAWANHALTRGLRQEASKNDGIARRVFTSAMSGAEAAVAMGMVGNLRRRFQRPRDAARGFEARAADRAGNIRSLMRPLQQMGRIAMIGSGAYLVMVGQMSGGGMMAAVILAMFALRPITSAVDNALSYQRARAAQGRLDEILGGSDPDTDVMTLPAPAGRVTLERVVARPPGAERPVLKGVDLALAPGEQLAIVGASGAGKTTLLRCLAGVVEPAGGSVRIDGAALAQWPAEQLGPHLGYLPQDIEILQGTVAENIARMQRVPSELGVVRAAKLAGLHDWVMARPEAYDTALPAGGGTLPGGRRQQLGLARAVYGDVRLVLLDEPTASLDTPGVEQVRRCLRRLRTAGISVVCATHDMSLARGADCVATLRDGQVQTLTPMDASARHTAQAVRVTPT